MQNFSKKFLAILLTLCMLASYVPFGVFAAEASAEVVNQQLMLGDDLTMHFYTKVENAANATATITVGGVKRAAYSLADMTAGDDGYDLSVDLAPAEMTEKLVLTVNDGASDILTKEYSVQSYAHYLLENNYTDETKALVKEMLNYGAKAQLYYGHKTGELANEGYVIETQATIPGQAPAMDVQGALPGVRFYGATLVLRSKIAVRFYFEVNANLADYGISVEGKAFTGGKKDGLYYIEVANINPDQMDTMLNVSVTKDEQALSISYSPMTYITRMYNKDTSSASLKALLKAANGYFAAAKVFTGVAENRTGVLSFQYRYGTSNLIQMNTNLPSDTPCVNFTANSNGCSIDQSGNTVQWVGWIGMENDSGTIVLTFAFNNAFEAGQTYTLPAGAVFGFADNSKYTLDANYTFTFDGSAWSMTAEEPEPEPTEPEENVLSFQYRYGTNNLIQVNTNLPVTTPVQNFTVDVNGCNIDQSANQYQQVGWIQMHNPDETGGIMVLTFHFNSAFTAGQSYVLPKGAVFGFIDGKTYTLDSDYTFTFDGSGWSMTAEEPEPEPEQKNIELAYRWGNNNTIQYNTNLPSDIPCANFTAGDNGCSLDQSGNTVQWVGWISMENVSGTIVLTFHFNNAFEAGQSYILSAGSVFGFTDGSSYTLPNDVVLYWDGSAWGTVAPITLTYRWGNNNTIQYNTNLPSDTPCANFLAGDNGCVWTQNGQQVGWVGMENVNGTIVLTFHFNAAFAYGESYALSAGSVFGFTDGSSYKLYQDVRLYWDDSQWTAEEPAPQEDVLDEGNFTGGDVITFADLPVNANDPAKIEEYKALGFNTSLLTEDHTAAKGPEELYKASMTTANAPENGLSFAYRYGTSNLIQMNTNLPSDTPCFNFTVGENGCSIDQSGNTVQWVGWIGMENVDGTIVLTFHFNNAFTAGQSYVLPKGAVFGFTDGKTYTLDSDYTFTFDGNGWTMDASTLQLSVVSAAGNNIQLKTNIPAGLTYGDFLPGQNGHNILLETTEGAQNVGWFQYGELGGAVYLVFHFNGYNKPGTQYILKAGTSLNAGERVYTTDRDYVFTFENDYLKALENIDAAGLNVWIRNYHNTADYFNDKMTAALKLYNDLIDGFYMTDEPFQTNALLQTSGQTNATDFESMGGLLNWFNGNFADKYFHVNHVPLSSWDHYTATNGAALEGIDENGYRNFLQTYKASFNDQLNGGASVSFDNYPFVHDQGKYGGFFGFGGTFESGIQDTYLLNCLIAAQVAGEDDFGLCIQTFNASDLKNKTSRDIASAAEVSLQVYTGLAMGADLFEYFAYNSYVDFHGIMNQDGTKRIYDLVKEGNQALCFADVVNSFTWNGIVTSAGSSNNHNGDAFSSVENYVLSNDTNGVLDSYSSTDDAVIGCFTKDSLNGYMLVNYNDPAAVTGNNSVTVTFANCTRARVYTQVNGVLTSEVVTLTNGSYTATLAPGAGCFIIPA